MPGKRAKHVPLRSCIACQGKKPKRELIRIVCTPEGSIEIDPRGKRAGRGAYVCRDPGCWEAGLDPQKLSRALKCRVATEQVAALKAQMASLSPGEELAQAPGAVVEGMGIGE
jgi:predicted RNA-binding protein YlxR (DUF448 family)